MKEGLKLNKRAIFGFKIVRRKLGKTWLGLIPTSCCDAKKNIHTSSGFFQLEAVLI